MDGITAMNNTNRFFFPKHGSKLFPTIDHSLIINDGYGYAEEDSFLDIDYQEASYGNDLDLASPNCEKNAQHEEFVHVNEFSLEDLPRVIQHPSVVVWIKYSAQLVVRISLKKNASGRTFINKDSQNIGRRYPCRDVNCPHQSSLGQAHFVYGELSIITNKHVVKSDDEAKHARIEFFYHDDDNRENVVKEHGHTIQWTNNNYDYTVFTCHYHLEGFSHRIELCTDIALNAWNCIPINIRKKLKQFAIVISHPHGTSKKVSIGKKIGSVRRNDSKDNLFNLKLLHSLYELCAKSNHFKKFEAYFSCVKDVAVPVTVTFYDAATCPGSSGAPVYMGNVQTTGGIDTITPHTHRGKDPVNGYNNCYT